MEEYYSGMPKWKRGNSRKDGGGLHKSIPSGLVPIRQLHTPSRKQPAPVEKSAEEVRNVEAAPTPLSGLAHVAQELGGRRGKGGGQEGPPPKQATPIPPRSSFHSCRGQREQPVLLI